MSTANGYGVQRADDTRDRGDADIVSSSSVYIG